MLRDHNDAEKEFRCLNLEKFNLTLFEFLLS